jgi:hypothetical protein
MRFDKESYKCYQTYDLLGIFQSTTSVPGVYSLAPALNAIYGTQLTAFQGVFDQYKIEEVEVWWEPQLQSTPLDETGGKLYSVIDYDDAANLTNVSQALSYSNCVVTPVTQGHYRRWKPRCAAAMYGGAFTQFGNVAAPWIDIASTGVQHYGCKLYTDLTSVTVVYDVRVRVRLAFRNIR